MIDLKAFTGRGFPGEIDRSIAEVPVSGIDREQAQGMVRLCRETEPVLYGPEFSPTRLRYRKGSRPALERITAGFQGQTPRELAVEARTWTSRSIAHPHLVGPLPPDRGLTEEQLIESGIGWCNEQGRVFIALCEVMEVPARLCFLFHANTRCAHTVTEAYVEGRWAIFDVSFDLCVELPTGELAEAWELSGHHRHLAHDAYRQPLEAHYRGLKPFVEDSPGWCSADRPEVDRGGDLLAHVGICNYLIAGVEIP